jgi:hypothetical protein
MASPRTSTPRDRGSASVASATFRQKWWYSSTPKLSSSESIVVWGSAVEPPRISILAVPLLRGVGDRASPTA